MGGFFGAVADRDVVMTFSLAWTIIATWVPTGVVCRLESGGRLSASHPQH
jgi:hypothetical protein